MKEQLKHIFDSSACLSRRQLKDYANGTMSAEEQYAVEHHITTCFFCSEALEGMTYNKDAMVAIEALNSNFLKDHFSLINPQVHLNSIAPTVQAQPIQRPSQKKTNTQPFFKPSSIAAALILGIGILWYFEYRNDNSASKHIIAQSAPAATEQSVAKTEEQAAALPEAGNRVVSASNNLTEQNSLPQPSGNSDNSQRPQALVATNPDASKTQASTAKEANAAGDTQVLSGNEPRNKAANDIEDAKMPREESTINAFTAPAVKNEPANNVARSNTSEIPKAPELRKSSAEDIESADDLYASGKYGAALTAYKKKMNSSGSHEEQYAALQAARCYINLGQKESAIKLLQSLADNASGASKRQAKRLLKEMGRETDE